MKKFKSNYHTSRKIEKLITKIKRLVVVTTTNEKCRDKIYKIYFDN